MGFGIRIGGVVGVPYQQWLLAYTTRFFRQFGVRFILIAAIRVVLGLAIEILIQSIAKVWRTRYFATAPS